MRTLQQIYKEALQSGKTLDVHSYATKEYFGYPEPVEEIARKYPKDRAFIKLQMYRGIYSA